MSASQGAAVETEDWVAEGSEVEGRAMVAVEVVVWEGTP